MKKKKKKKNELKNHFFSKGKKKKNETKTNSSKIKMPDVEPYRPYGCKSPDWKRFLKAGEELTRGQLLLSADHKSKAVRGGGKERR